MMAQEEKLEPMAPLPIRFAVSSNPSLMASMSFLLDFPVKTVNRHCWPFFADGAQVPASRAFLTSSMGTGSSV